MKKYAFSFHVEEHYDEPVSRHSFLLRCAPGTYPFQRSYAHKLAIRPFTALTYITDVFGNEMCTGTIDKKHDSFSYTASGFVLSSKYLIHEPLDRLFLYSTPTTRPTDGMRLLIENAALPSDDYLRARILCTKTHTLITRREMPGCRTAPEIFASGYGNAMEIATVFITLCRLSGIAARFISGLAVGVDRPHAWAEVYCGSCWRALDPSTGCEITEGYLKVAQAPDCEGADMARSVCAEQVSPSRFVTEVKVTEHVILTRDTVPHA